MIAQYDRGAIDRWPPASRGQMARALAFEDRSRPYAGTVHRGALFRSIEGQEFEVKLENPPRMPSLFGPDAWALLMANGDMLKLACGEGMTTAQYVKEVVDEVRST